MFLSGASAGLLFLLLVELQCPLGEHEVDVFLVRCLIRMTCFSIDFLKEAANTCFNIALHEGISLYFLAILLELYVFGSIFPVLAFLQRLSLDCAWQPNVLE